MDHMVSLSCQASGLSVCAHSKGDKSTEKKKSINVAKFWIYVYCFITWETKMEQPVFKQLGRNIM